MNLGKLGQAFTAREIFDLIHDELEQVEKRITVESVASVDAVTAIGQYLQSSGGKRLRPTLLLISSKLFNGTSSSATAVQLGAVVELLHAATLVHDDVIDAAETRRGRPSSNVKWGNHTCVLAGDWLYMQAFQMALRERNFQILDLLIGLTQMMVEGELLQLDRIGKIDVTEADCMELVDRKTACLFSVCARLGALAGHADTQSAGTARRIRLESRDGVPVGGRRPRFHSARENARQARRRRSARGQGHLATVYALERAAPAERRLVETILRDRNYETVRFAQILSLLEKYRGIERVKERAQAFTDKARNIIGEFPDSPYQRALLAVTELVTGTRPLSAASNHSSAGRSQPHTLPHYSPKRRPRPRDHASRLAGRHGTRSSKMSCRKRRCTSERPRSLRLSRRIYRWVERNQRLHARHLEEPLHAHIRARHPQIAVRLLDLRKARHQRSDA